MVYGTSRLAPRTLRYVARRGIHPWFILPKGGAPQALPGDGFAIGMLDDIEYDEQTLRLHPGDRVYFYSDGVPEAMNANLDQFTDARMLAAVLSQSGFEIALGQRRRPF